MSFTGRCNKGGEVFSLAPFYLAGCIVAGALLVLLSRNIRNSTAATLIRWTGIAVTPGLLLILLAFTGSQRQRTYEMEPLLGSSALQYLSVGASQQVSREFPVVLKRASGRHHDCFEAFDSKSLTQYLGAHSSQPVSVSYTITYDFFRPRNIQIQRVGEFGPTSDVLLHDARETGERTGPDSDRAPCFAW